MRANRLPASPYLTDWVCRPGAAGRGGRRIACERDRSSPTRNARDSSCRGSGCGTARERAWSGRGPASTPEPARAHTSDEWCLPRTESDSGLQPASSRSALGCLAVSALPSRADRTRPQTAARAIRWSFSRPRDRKSTRLNSSHSQISYAVFCLKKKKISYICVIVYTNGWGTRVGAVALDRQNVVPLYYQIQQSLTEQIRSSGLKPYTLMHTWQK